MNFSIQISPKQIGNQSINSIDARELHKALEIKKDFSDWIKAQINRAGLEKQVDYIVFPKKGENLTGGRPTHDYILTTDAAKHIAMMSQSRRGKEVRDYFIEAEKQLHDPTISSPVMTQIMDGMARMVQGMSAILQTQERMLDRLDALEHKDTPLKLLPDVRTNFNQQLYTRAEETAIVSLKALGYSSDEIGAIIDRSGQAVRCKLHRMRHGKQR